MSSLIWMWIILFLFIIVSGAMVLIILVQRPQGGGLAGAFGGSGSTSDTVFGGRVGDALTWATVGAFVLYLVLAVGMNVVDDYVRSGASKESDTPTATQAPGTEAPAESTPAPSTEMPPAGSTAGESAPAAPRDEVKSIGIETAPAPAPAPAPGDGATAPGSAPAPPPTAPEHPE